MSGGHRKLDEERREEALRPAAFLGYNRDELAMYLVEREAYALAESQLRRAVWLNPFEPLFKAHLAFCLFRQGRSDEAREWMQQALEQGGAGNEIERLRRLICRTRE